MTDGMIPYDEQVLLDADAQLEAAADSALDDPYGEVAPEAPPVPFGRTWRFDFERQRFERLGTAPAEVAGYESLEQWLLTAASTAIGVHAAVDPEFGIEAPNGLIGHADPTEMVPDWIDGLRDAWMMHDRVVDVDPIEVSYDSTDGTVYIERIEVVTDEGESIVFADIPIAPEV